MGNAFSDCAGSPTPRTLTSSQDNDQPEPSYGYFNKIESTHLQNVQRSMREEARNNHKGSNFMTLVWRCAHTNAVHKKHEEKYASKITQRCNQFGAVSNGLRVVDALSCVLKEKFLKENDFVEFVSNVCSGAYGHKTTLEFVWEICCCEGSQISLKDTIPADVVINICVEIAELNHYMVLDDAFTSASGGVVKLKETRNVDRVRNVVQSLSSSLLEYANSSQNDYEYGAHTTSNTSSTNENKSINKRQLIEWQRKVAPDMFHNSIEQFLQILFFPPEFDNTNGIQLFRRYNFRTPLLHSSKELMPRTASRLGDGEVIPIKSATFGQNYVDNVGTSNTDSVGRIRTKMFAPEVFAFTTISASKFGNKWYRVYSGTEDGWTFNQLENSIIGYEGPTLVVIQASSNNHPGSSVTFGAYTAAKWEKNKKNFFGSADCFLFQLLPTVRVMKSLPKMGTRGGHYMYFHSNTNVASNNLAKKDELVEGFGFGGTLRHPRLFIDRTLEECRVSPHDTTFEEGHLGFPPPNDPLASSFSATNSSSSTLHIDSLEVFAVGDDDCIQRGFRALAQYRDIADANLRNARTVDKAAFMGDLRNGVIKSKAFAHRGQVDGRAHGALKGEDGKANGL